MSALTRTEARLMRAVKRLMGVVKRLSACVEETERVCGKEPCLTKRARARALRLQAVTSRTRD
jgi:hypothetical protein